MKNVLFVCIENSCRSQMAEAFGNIYGQEIIKAYSGGSRPSGRVNPRAVASMRDTGYDLTAHTSKGLNDIPAIEYDLVVSMGCGEACPDVRARARQDWDIPDPKEMNEQEFAEVRDLIRDKVQELISKYRLKAEG